MSTFELTKMGLMPIENLDMRDVNGGSWGKWFKRISLAGIGKEIIDHWDEIKKGLHDGWNFDKK